MALIVQKYGGTSLGSIERITNVASLIANDYKKGHKLVVVASAMSGETNRLIALANTISPTPNARDLATISSTGEQISIALLSLALNNLNIKTTCYLGWQLPIITTQDHLHGRICSIDCQKIEKDLDTSHVVIVAGFQGITSNGNITTLGRGGSDTSAVALSVRLNADECQIYTDVDGVYNSDPNQVASAKKIDIIDGVSMIEAASLGAKVLHVRSCELAYRYHINLRVLSTFNQHSQGTLVMNQTQLENYPLLNLSLLENQALVSFNANKNLNEIIAKLYQITNLDMLNICENSVNFVCENDSVDALLETLSSNPNITNLKHKNQLNKISLIGSGFRSNPTLNKKIWDALSDSEIFATSHNEISISFLIHDWEKATVRNKLCKLLG